MRRDQLPRCLREHAEQTAKETARRGQAALLARFEAEIDPDGTLPAAERRKRAEMRRHAHMVKLSAEASKRRGSAGGGLKATRSARRSR